MTPILYADMIETHTVAETPEFIKLWWKTYVHVVIVSVVFLALFRILPLHVHSAAFSKARARLRTGKPRGAARYCARIRRN